MGKGQQSSEAADPCKRQAAWGAWIVIAGLVAIVIIFGASLVRFSKASDVATAVGSVSGVIAALIGAYFGIRGSTVAQAQVIEMMNRQPKSPDGTASDETKPPDGAG